MTYLQRATPEQKEPFFYAVSDTTENGFYKTLCVCTIPERAGIDVKLLSRGFFKPYIKITEKEFNDAKAAAQHVLDSFDTEIIK